jgi:hypothetical protein
MCVHALWQPLGVIGHGKVRETIHHPQSLRCTVRDPGLLVSHAFGVRRAPKVSVVAVGHDKGLNLNVAFLTGFTKTASTPSWGGDRADSFVWSIPFLDFGLVVGGISGV